MEIAAGGVGDLTHGGEGLDMSATRHVGYETMLETNGMSRAFGYNEVSTFDITMGNGFDMPADLQRTTRMLLRASTNPSGSRKLEYDGSRGRGMTEDGIMELAGLLNATSTNIEALSLRYLEISDAGCEALALALSKNWTLGRFEFHGNKISDKSCRKLVDSLKRHKLLAILEQGGGPLRQNTVPQHVYAKALFNALKVTKSVRLVKTQFF
eukprot:COSAG05_NODE_707_length_7848_cov_6.252420_8_plen_211_part_00